jgi:putative ABC transport system permease protein
VLRRYLTLALKVLARRKVFTAISLIGICFTLVVLTVAAALLDHVFAPHPPEVRLDRTLAIFSVEMSGPTYRSMSPAGYRLLDQYARGLPGVERLAICSLPGTVNSWVDGRKVESYLRRTDADFWRVLSFDFLEGGPFADGEVERASMVAVINESTRRRFFGEAPAVGRAIEADGQRFTVVGVVRDVPILRIVPFSDIWVPLTTAKSDGWRRGLRGHFWGLLLARDRADFPAIRAEFASRIARVDFQDEAVETLVAVPDTLFAHVSRLFLFQRGEGESHPERLAALLAGLGFLFMVLPAVNLVNLNMSRILERAPEIGVRKAFGASSWTLVGQFLVENVVLAVLGGLLAFVAAHFVLGAIDQTGLIPYSDLRLNPRVFLGGLALAVVFGVVSGVYPAWRMSRLHPVEALKGGTR